MKTILKLIITALAVIGISYIVPGISVDGFTTALLVAVVFTIINWVVRPVVSLIALPITIVTLGLFRFVVNAALFYAITYVVSGFVVDGILAALIGSIILSFVSGIIDRG